MKPDNRFQCKVCTKKFKRRFNLTVHKKTQHKSIIKKVKCPLWPICKNIHKSDGFYSTISNLVVHYKKHHPKNKLNKKQLKWIVQNRIKKTSECIDSSVSSDSYSSEDETPLNVLLQQSEQQQSSINRVEMHDLDCKFRLFYKLNLCFHS